MGRDQIIRILGDLNFPRTDGTTAPWIPGATFHAVPWLQEFLVELFTDLRDRPAGVVPTEADYAGYARVAAWMKFSV